MIETLKAFEEFIILLVVTAILIFGAIFSKLYVIPKKEELLEMIAHLGNSSKNDEALQEIIISMLNGFFKVADSMATVVIFLSIFLIMVAINSFKRGKANKIQKI